jgi:hypothetical protein
VNVPYAILSDPRAARVLTAWVAYTVLVPR